MSKFPFEVKEHVLPCQHLRTYYRATANAQEEVLQLAIKQYIPLGNENPKPGDVTIIGAHANGFPKELYEPLWEEMLLRAKTAGISIRGIWIADVAHQGASGVLNEGKLGNDPSWFDHPRDLLHMVNSFRDQMVRPIVGVGHSMGGNNLVNLALMHPRLMETLILIDPVIQRQASVQGNFAPAAASARRRDLWPSRSDAAAAFKKSKFYQTWDPRVLELWVKYGLRALPTALYPSPKSPKLSPTALTVEPTVTPPVASGEATPTTTTEPTLAPPTESTDGGEVTLTTTKHQEVFTFLRPNFEASTSDAVSEPGLVVTTSGNRNKWSHPDADPTSGIPNSAFYRPEPIMTFHLLPHLRPSVFYVFGETSDLSAPESRADKMSATGTGVGGSGGAPEGRVLEVIIQGAGHLIPMEAVGETADRCVEWLGKEMHEWHEREQQEQKAWAAVPDAAKRVLSPQYLKMLTGSTTESPPRGQKL